MVKYTEKTPQTWNQRKRLIGAKLPHRYRMKVLLFAARRRVKNKKEELILNTQLLSKL
jgi:hypothetical protein